MPRSKKHKKTTSQDSISSNSETTPTERRTSQNTMTQNDEETYNVDEIIPLKPSNKSQQRNPHSHHQKHKHIKVFGLNVTHWNPTVLFVSFSCCHIICSVLFAYLQEKVNTIEGFSYPKFMTLIQTATYTLCAFIEMQSMSGELGYITKPSSPIINYFKLSILTFSGMYFTNWGLQYLSYPTRIIFKAAKPVPTMILEYFYVKKLFSKSDIASVAVLTLGIILFCSGEARDTPNFHSTGVLLMTLGVFADALTSNYEKKHIFSYGASHAEAMFFASLMGTIWTICTLFITERSMLFEAVAFCIGNPIALAWLFVSSFGGYMSVVFILLLIKCFSTTYAECVKGLRKVCSIAISYLFLSKGKTFGYLHGAGLICFGTSIIYSIYHKADRKQLMEAASGFISKSQLLSGFLSRSNIKIKASPSTESVDSPK